MSTLPYKIKDDIEKDAFRLCVADNIHFATRNLFYIAQVVTRGETDDIGCLEHKYSEIINPKPVETRTKEQIIDEIDAEFEKLGFKQP